MEGEDKINENQIYTLITGEEVSWQSIIHDLIKTEQLDPWNIDIGVLADKYLTTIQEMEEENFYVSSKVLLACSILLRLKTDILANSYIQELNEALFGRKEVQKTLDLEQYIIDEKELPLLVPKSPMARHRKVTLDELMSALNKAINTENRRIKRSIKTSQAKKAAEMVLPKNHFIPLKVRIKKIVEIINGHLTISSNKHIEFTKLASEKEEKLAAFLPILHLSNDKHIHTYQPIHFEEIFITKDMHPEDVKASQEELELYVEEQ
jgi:segregation and condensation protein A